MKNMKIKFYDLDLDGRIIKVAPIIRQYTHGEGLAIELIAENFEPFDDLTSNLCGCELTTENCAFVNTNTYYDVKKFLLDNKLAFQTFRQVSFNFNTYTEFLFDLEKLNDGEELDKLMDQLHELYDQYDENPSALSEEQINMLKNYNVI